VIGEWADQADEGNTSIVTAQYVTIGGAFDFSERRRHFRGCCFPAGHVPVDIRKRQDGTPTGPPWRDAAS